MADNSVITIGHAAGCLISIRDGIYQVQPREVLQVPLKLPRGAKVNAHVPESRYLLATVVHLPSSKKEYSLGLLQAIISQYRADDDVWNSEFLQVILSTRGGKWKLKARTSGIIPEHSTFISDRLLEKVPPGPYAIERSTGKLFEIRRLYQDTFQAFIYGVAMNLEDNTSYDIFTTCLEGSQTPTISVPSRLYSIGDSRPLAGLRFSVKDIIDVKGLKTGCGSRAYHSLYPARQESAPVIKRLLAAGAVLVGKVKTSQFAAGEKPTAEWVDYHCPFNPRGDGYQQPSSSSTGSAVSVAAYPWVDFAVGTDTGGSIREPAGLQGIFGSRPSWGAVETDLVMPVSKHLDTVGVFSRDAEVFKAVGEVILTHPGQEKPPQKRFATNNVGRLLYPIDAIGSQRLQWFPHPSQERRTDAEEDMEIFVRRAEDLWGVKREVFNLDELWEKTRPEGQPASLDDALGTVYSILTCCSGVHGLNDKFIADYSKANGGRKPFINPTPRFRQAFGRKQGAEAYDAALRTKDMFKSWAERILFPPRDDGKETVMIFPQAMGLPMYIDTPGEPPCVCYEFSVYSLGYLVGCPDYTIPISEVLYHSVVAEAEEYLPVAVSMVSSIGNDRFLFELIKSMQDERIVRPVSPGRRLFNTEDFGDGKELVTTSTEDFKARKVPLIVNGELVE